MLIGFLLHLRRCGLGVSTTELLDLLDALKHDLVFADLDQFYLLSRTILIKNEALFDRYDRAFSSYFKSVEHIDDLFESLIPDEWLRTSLRKHLSEALKAKAHSLGDLEKLLDALRKRLEEQNERHAGGNKWIGTGGTSPFGHSGYHPEGIRVGGQSQHKKAVKIWEQRQYRNLDEDQELGSRSIKVALKRLRRFGRSGAADELDIDDTIRSTAANGGLLDIVMRPQRKNAVKLLLLMDVGGSMDVHVRKAEALFSAAKNEFKYMEFFYFHNCIYENLWRDNHRRQASTQSTFDVLNTYGPDVKLVIVGDASMSPYEIAVPGGSVEHSNAEAGEIWLQRLFAHFQDHVWLNPEAEDAWQYVHSVQMVQQWVKMFPLTLNGLDQAMRELAKS